VDFIEDIRVGQECAETGFGAEIDCPAAIFGPREIGRIGVAKDPSTEGDEARMSLLRKRMGHHFYSFG